MLIAEIDIEQIEQYLDGALDQPALAQLQSRLKSDKGLANAMADLKSQHVMRAAVWQSMEGNADAANRLMWRVRGAMLQQDKQTQVQYPKLGWNQWGIARLGTAAAACLVLGFMFGRVGHNNIGATPAALQSPVNIASNNTSTPFDDEVKPAVEPVQHETVAQGNAVPITNEYGKIVAWQRFSSPEEARQFARDLPRSRNDSNSPAVSGPSRLAADEHPQVPF